MDRRAAVFAALLVLLAACTHNVNPRITPAKVPAVEPPLAAHALLLITPSFENYSSQSSSGIHRFNYNMGASAATALADLVTKSFAIAHVRRVTDAESIQLLAGPADTSGADFLLIPHFETGGYSEGAVKIASDVRLRLDVRAYRTNAALSWTTLGHTARVFSSRRGLTGSSLEQALGALADTLKANRSRLDLTP